MLRDNVWYSYDKECQGFSFDALKVVHKVTNSDGIQSHCSLQES